MTNLTKKILKNTKRNSEHGLTTPKQDTLPLHLIEPTRGWSFLCLHELWKYQELFYFLTLRDIKVRYKQTVFGILWALLQPIVSVLIFTILFAKLIHVPLSEISYPLFVLSGWLPWMFFLNGVNAASNSLVADANLLKKVYFPRLIIPMAKISSGFIEFFITLSLLFLMMYYQGYTPGVEIILLPLAVLYLFLITSCIGVWLSAINAIFHVGQ